MGISADLRGVIEGDFAVRGLVNKRSRVALLDTEAFSSLRLGKNRCSAWGLMGRVAAMEDGIM
jgi:hypothetical protein